jgi:hypothetical protein
MQLEPNDLTLFRSENGKVYSGGFSVNSILLKKGISPITTLNGIDNQNNGSIDVINGSVIGGQKRVSDLFQNLAVPAGLLSGGSSGMSGISGYNSKYGGVITDSDSDSDSDSEYESDEFRADSDSDSELDDGAFDINENEDEDENKTDNEIPESVLPEKVHLELFRMSVQEIDADLVPINKESGLVGPVLDGGQFKINHKQSRKKTLKKETRKLGKNSRKRMSKSKPKSKSKPRRFSKTRKK